ncbi:MAG: metallophosphoesterase [Sulfurovum sp.]|nr:metallophosphoesterase [Sulfurovum sp.]
MKKLIVYGDIHGCYDEFRNLREKIKPDTNDIEVCVGDTITKGKKSIKVLNYLIKHNIKSVLGNHEDKLIRYLLHEKSNKKNPIILNLDEEKIVKELQEKHIHFLMNMPLFFKLGNIIILHGGIQNSCNLNRLKHKDKSKILRMRYLDKNEKFVMYGEEDSKSIFWADTYNGEQGFIIYGHQWFKDIKVNKYSVGIDTGCVYDNKLSAIILEDNSKNNWRIESIDKL